MTLRVEVISRETIKPSSPTPDCLRTLKLSVLDQYMCHCPVPAILFYAAPAGNSNKDTHLKLDCFKKSLSQILTHFYPLAGRINNNRFVNCNDEGVNFFEARVNNARLNQVLANPIPEEMDGLLPKDDDVCALLSVQVNIFECGGIALGVCIGHKVADASSFSLFLNSWAAMARGDYEDNLSRPKFNMASIFPPREEDVPNPTFPFEIQNTVCKRFVFSASNISALKAKSSNSLYVENPTRAEVVSSLLWRCAMKARQESSTKKPSSSALHLSVNLRPRLNPPLTNLYMGNPLISTIAKTPTEPGHPPELHFLVGQLRKTLRLIDSKYVGKLLGVDDGIELHNASLDEVFEQSGKGEVELFLFTVWCRTPFYEADFGWGTPAWVTFANFYLPNYFKLMDTKSGDGVEAYVTLLKEDMARFEAQPDLLAFTTSINGDSS